MFRKLNFVSVILVLKCAILISAYGHISNHGTSGNYKAPIVDYHQQDHHENSEVNQEIYVHETHHEDEPQDYDGGSHGGYGFSFNHGHEENTHGSDNAGHQEYSYGHEEPGHQVYSHATEHQSYNHGGEALGHSQNAHESSGRHTNTPVHADSGSHSGNNAGHTNSAPAHSYTKAEFNNVAVGHNHDEGHEGHGHDEGAGHDGKHEDYYHHPAYKYEYGVDDPKTKDRKSHWEHRDGDVVKGEYTLSEPDGTIRKVSYTSDKHSGFQAHVEKIGHATHDDHQEGAGHGGSTHHHVAEHGDDSHY